MKAQVARLVAQLAELYPDATTELHFETPFQLLVATMLSAQCTDQRVNMVTPELFARFPDAAAMSGAPVEEIETLIGACNFFHTKARNLLKTARLLMNEWGGVVPANRDDLMTLPGVGRKTANVVVANAFGQAAIAVDTHVFRVAHRLGWAVAPDADGTEQELMKLLPRKLWSEAHHWLILHGRRVCGARRPNCAACPLAPDCPKKGLIKVEVGVSSR